MMAFVAFSSQVPWILMKKVSKNPIFSADYSHNSGIWNKVADFLEFAIQNFFKIDKFLL